MSPLRHINLKNLVPERDEILTLFRDLHQRLETTVVIVTHDMWVAERCGHTISLRDGRVVDDVRR